MEFRSLPGLTPYETARRLQLELVERRVAGEIPDTVLFLEHAPVITRGRGLQDNGSERPRQMPLPALPPGVEFAESERGGDLTYHGPGQLVIYPICKLGGEGIAAERDVARFIRKLEAVLIDELGARGVTAHSVPKASGVWVGPRKVASVGIAVRKWVTYHGVALNCVNDLSPFGWFSPCGFAPEVMTRVQDVLPEEARGGFVEGWRSSLECALAARLRMLGMVG